jgi:oxygen-dependent protoporphyrinogen oxidase
MNETADPSDTTSILDAVIIGGGISGLTLARALQAKGRRLRLLESSERMGGAIQSERKEGFLCEAGPNSMLVKAEPVWTFLEDIGLGKSIQEANAISNKRFLVKNGSLVALPQSLRGGITTPLYSFPEKLRLLAEPFIGRSQMHDESVTSFVSRRMGPAFLEYGISALVSGIFAGDPDRLSLRHAFPKVWNLEQNFGSLIGGALKLKRQRKKEGVTPWKSRMISFPEGLQQMVTSLSGHLGNAASTGVRVEHIDRTSDGTWTVTLPSDTLTTRKLIVATPLGAIPGLPFSWDLQVGIRDLQSLPHPPLSTLVLGFPRSQVSHPLDGFGVLFPRLEKRFALGCIFSTTLFPGRAPEGMVSLMCFIGGVQQPENGSLPTSQLVEKTVADLRPLLGLKGQPSFHAHTFWPAAIPQYNVGHQQFLDQLVHLETAYPGLHFRGNYRGGPGLSDCIENALLLAQEL